MAQRLVAADASPLIGLASAGAFDLLRELFHNVTVIAAVRDEVLAGGELPGAPELDAAIRDGWIEIVPNPRDPEFVDLGTGYRPRTDRRRCRHDSSLARSTTPVVLDTHERNELVR